ncbi:hypothetical protein [Acetobacter peroxydans]|uniref:Uncharacterized protein n=1 Tax=Acetobacter peroxydans TaxID=104098 RepID=A0A4Y3TWK4_9PROT|nr:hypothetical protein [Acetobacter peroxydans]NHO17149.1 hypothetical protein [Acetobacter peroxydans]GBR33412.1 hypothetical protein AA13755_0524 [Acetobacter peroxydans NBRC 13755]GBR39463.1 hypothetical protein AA0475_0200 [Acetobacter peroxydans]GEB86232.1 hypothetical protein APE01nite_20290 [Acetobacter peroxydans]
MKLSPQTREDIKDMAGFLFGVAGLLVLMSGILFGPDVLAAIAADHPIAMVQEAVLATR